MDIFDEYATDPTAELEGVWESFGKGARIKIARLGNKNYTKMLAKEIETNDSALKTEDDAADALSEEIMAKVLANTILLGIEGVTFKKKSVEDTVEGRKALLLLKDFRKDIMERAGKREKFQAKYEEEQGNA